MTIKILDEDVVYFGSALSDDPLVAGMRISERLLFGTATAGGGGVPTVNVLLSGVSPLTLLNAVSLNYVKAFGKCEQDLTPTPTSPVDIVCNNGAIKVRHQSGLPLGYQPYEYITASGTQWLDTGIKLASTDIVEAEFQNSSTTGYGALYGVFAAGDSSAFYANGTYYGYDAANGKVDTGVSVDTSWHTLRFDYANGIITLDGNNTTYTPFVFDNAKNNYLFARYYNNSYGYGFKGSCKRFKVIRNNEVICDLIPAKSSFSNAIGMFDLANNVFYGNVGTGDFTATNPINDLEVYYDGTVETVQAHGKNLFDVNNPYKSGYAITQNGSETAVTNFSIYSLKAEPLTKYTYSCNYAESVTTRIHSYDKNGDWIQQDTYGNANATKTFTTTSNTAEIRISINNTAALSAQLELGSTATTYEPYFEGNTVTCQPLLSVGTYKDSQNITNGAITRNVGIKVLDGTESGWNKSSSYQGSFYLSGATALWGTEIGATALCSHLIFKPTGSSYTSGKFFFDGSLNLWNPNFDSSTTLDTFTQWLKDEYANGTPVIIVFRLKTATTETVTGQTLTITQGTNIVTAEGSIDDLELEVSYKAYAEVTVEEIEAVNTDENVEVTIS